MCARPRRRTTVCAHRTHPPPALRASPVAVRELQREKAIQQNAISTYEKSIYPMESDVPVSELSTKYWGDKCWHTQPKKAMGAPSTHQKWKPPVTTANTHGWSKRQWDVDRIQFVREDLRPAHVHTRMLAIAKEADA